MQLFEQLNVWKMNTNVHFDSGNSLIVTSKSYNIIKTYIRLVTEEDGLHLQ